MVEEYTVHNATKCTTKQHFTLSLNNCNFILHKHVSKKQRPRTFSCTNVGLLKGRVHYLCRKWKWKTPTPYFALDTRWLLCLPETCRHPAIKCFLSLLQQSDLCSASSTGRMVNMVLHWGMTEMSMIRQLDHAWQWDPTPTQAPQE